jgi:CheY-like chemotaxis protein
MEQDVARTQEAGFMMHLTKPVKIQELEKALNAAVKLCS